MTRHAPLLHRINRRTLLEGHASVVGTAALAGLLDRDGFGAEGAARTRGAVVPHVAPRAKRVVYLFQSGGPSHLELLDHKPRLREFHGQ
jgi:hypothetical protein